MNVRLIFLIGIYNTNRVSAVISSLPSRQHISILFFFFSSLLFPLNFTSNKPLTIFIECDEYKFFSCGVLICHVNIFLFNSAIMQVRNTY